MWSVGPRSIWGVQAMRLAYKRLKGWGHRAAAADDVHSQLGHLNPRFGRLDHECVFVSRLVQHYNILNDWKQEVDVRNGYSVWY